MKKSSKLRNAIRNVLSTLVILGGVLGVLYPTLSNYLNERNASYAIEIYDSTVAEMEEEKRRQMLEEARLYNKALLAKTGFDIPLADGAEYIEPEQYDEILRMESDGLMGYLELPRLAETVPIYHSSSEATLQIGIGHMENTCLPVGGNSTHAVLTGHRGLPSRQLFTDLDLMVVGDVFYVNVLGEKLAYQIDQILTVLPSEFEALAITENEDYVTLVTCRPYGVNTHRLLVRGTRIPYEEAEKIVTETEEQKPLITQSQKELLMALAVLVIFFSGRFLVRLWNKQKKKKQKKENEKSFQ